MYAFTSSTVSKRNLAGQATMIASSPDTSETYDRFEGRKYPLPMRMRRPDMVG